MTLHPAARLIKFKALDNTNPTYLRVPGKSMLLRKVRSDIGAVSRYRPNAGPGWRRRCIPQGRKRHRLCLMLPMLKGPLQIPRAGFKIHFRVEQILRVKILDLVFARPFSAALSLTCIRPRSPALPIFRGSKRLSRQTTAFTSIGSSWCSVATVRMRLSYCWKRAGLIHS